MTTRSSAPPAPVVRRRLAGSAAVGLGGVAVVAALVAPPDAVQGQAQRLMYLHVPAAWTGMLAFGVVLVSSLAYLIRPTPAPDRYARAAAEIGVALTALAVVTGSVWARAVWGVWWAWDPRLVSTALMLLVYLGHVAVRRLSGDERRDARRAAVLGVAGFALVPVVHFSVVWWRSLHQPATVLAGRVDPPIDPRMAVALLIAAAAVTAAAAWALLCRVAALERSAADRSAAPDGVAAEAVVG